MPALKYDENEVRSQLAAFMGRHNELSLTKFATMSSGYSEGVSKATLSMFQSRGTMNGKEKRNLSVFTQETLRAIVKTMDGYEGVMSEPVNTKSLETILAAAEAAIGRRKIYLIVGESGTGKTTAFREYTKQHPDDVIAMTANQQMGVRAMLTELCRSTNTYYAVRRTPHEILIELAELELKQIVIDEADKLKQTCFECLRFLRDRAGTSIILLGMPCIMRKLTVGPTRTENLQQLYSRIGFYKKLESVKPAEVRLIVERMGITQPEMVAAIVKHSKINGHINLHRTEELVDGVKEYAATNKKDLDDADPDWVNELMSVMI